jgi:hypothetical protein
MNSTRWIYPIPSAPPRDPSWVCYGPDRDRPAWGGYEPRRADEAPYHPSLAAERALSDWGRDPEQAQWWADSSDTRLLRGADGWRVEAPADRPSMRVVCILRDAAHEGADHDAIAGALPEERAYAATYRRHCRRDGRPHPDLAAWSAGWRGEVCPPHPEIPPHYEGGPKGEITPEMAQVWAWSWACGAAVKQGTPQPERP